MSELTPRPAPRVVVVGSINMDLVARVPQIPRPGETLTGQSLEYIPGGKGANQAVAAARLGAEVRMCGRLGDDAFASTLRQGLAASNVDVAHVLPTGDCSSGVAWISVDDTGGNAITVIPGANGCVTPDDVAAWEAVIQSADVLLLQMEIPPDSVLAAIGLARQAGIPVILDVAPVPPCPLPSELWQVDLLTPNQIEAEQLTGRRVETVADAAEVALELLHRGPRHVVVKIGAMGAVLASRDGTKAHVPAFPIQPVDTTAAGDAFTAALAVEWASGRSLERAIRWACAAGGAAAERPGAQPAMPTRADVEAIWRHVT